MKYSKIFPSMYQVFHSTIQKMLQQIKWYLLTRPERQWLDDTKNKNQKIKPKNKETNF